MFFSSVAVFGRYVAGGSVDALLKQYGPLGSNVVARYAAETLAGLIYLHANGIVQCVVIPSYIQIAHIVYEFVHFIIIVSFTFFSLSFFIVSAAENFSRDIKPANVLVSQQGQRLFHLWRYFLIHRLTKLLSVYVL